MTLPLKVRREASNIAYLETHISDVKPLGTKLERGNLNFVLSLPLGIKDLSLSSRPKPKKACLYAADKIKLEHYLQSVGLAAFWEHFEVIAAKA